VPILDVTVARGARLKGGGEKVGLCPSCGAHDRFGINNTRKGLFHCRGWGRGEDAIVRMWFKHPDTRWCRQHWAMLLGDSPAPRSLKEAYARRTELVRPAFVDLDRKGNFWRVVRADYENDEIGTFLDLKPHGAREESGIPGHMRRGPLLCRGERRRGNAA
jgi:hypothetical protein